MIAAAAEARGDGDGDACGPGLERPASYTTPEGDDVARFAREVLDAGASHLVMEVSSHGLALHRVDAVRFRVAAFTNLTQDHLDFHGDPAHYGEARRGSSSTSIRERGAQRGRSVRRGAGRPSAPRWRSRSRRRAGVSARSVERGAGRRASPRPREVALNAVARRAQPENLLVALGCALASTDSGGCPRPVAMAAWGVAWMIRGTSPCWWISAGRVARALGRPVR
jgi:UDP-N-acetylmuramoyl-L-alanyl-D-glutamate--2,6-diaminopimelate ligase